MFNVSAGRGPIRATEPPRAAAVPGPVEEVPVWCSTTGWFQISFYPLCFSGPWVNPYDRASPEKLLCRDLLRKYHSLGLNGRPVMDRNRTITVFLKLGLIQVDLDEKSRILTLSVWAQYVSEEDVALRELILSVLSVENISLCSVFWPRLKVQLM